MKIKLPHNKLTATVISRRTLVAGVVAVTASGVNQMARADEEKTTELEVANETLVNNFCRDWSLRDVEKLRPYLAEDLFHQQAPGRPVMESRDDFEKQMGDWLKSLKSVEFEILRSHVVGEFFVENGVIKVWKDWPMPGSKPVFG